MDNITLVEDLFVLISGVDDETKRPYEVVLALYTICHSMDCIIDEIEESDLPEESLRDGYRAVRESISSLIESVEQYRKDKVDTFMSSCED